MSWTTSTLIQILNAVNTNEKTLEGIQKQVNLQTNMLSLFNQKLVAILNEQDMVDKNLPTVLNAMKQQVETLEQQVIALQKQLGELHQITEHKDNKILGLLNLIQVELVPQPAVGFTVQLTTL